MHVSIEVRIEGNHERKYGKSRSHRRSLGHYFYEFSKPMILNFQKSHPTSSKTHFTPEKSKFRFRVHRKRFRACYASSPTYPPKVNYHKVYSLPRRRIFGMLARLIRTDLGVSSSTGAATVDLGRSHLQTANFSRGFAFPGERLHFLDVEPPQIQTCRTFSKLS